MNHQTVITNQASASFNSSVKTLELTAEGVRLLDQTRLPHEVRYDLIQTPEAMAEAIQTMKVRGAPAIGIAGAFGGVLSIRTFIQNPQQNAKQ
ncbi:MAG: hypothetical protein K2X66_11690, partial [Cyanobacteria bacterium]|nr:hypothetical protein [Cyanobacteriota bacterium]